MAAKSVKMCDMPLSIAVRVLKALNPDTVEVVGRSKWSTRIVVRSLVEPKDLIYPEGWYYAKGCFRNKHMSSTGRYEEAKMLKPSGEPWKLFATYCTLDD